MLAEIDALKKLRDDGILPSEVFAFLASGAGHTVPKSRLDDANTHDVLIFLIDCSPSIAQRNLIEGVIEGQNAALDAISGADARRSIIFGQFLFDEGYRELQPLINMRTPMTQQLEPDVVRLSRSNYAIGNGTAIRDAVLRALAAFSPYAEREAELGITFFYRLLVITDGEDVSSKVSPADCKKVLDIVRSIEPPLLSKIILLGIGSLDYRKAAVEMGIGADDVFTCNDDPRAIRAAIDMASRKVIG